MTNTEVKLLKNVLKYIPDNTVTMGCWVNTDERTHFGVGKIDIMSMTSSNTSTGVCTVTMYTRGYVMYLYE